MNRKKGFTLVELLVVMAIIAILASIVVPNVQRYIVRARVTRAVAEVSGMELALTAVMTDSGRGNMSQMFLPRVAPDELRWPETTDNLNAFTPQLFLDAADIYSQVAYELLRMGRECLMETSKSIVPRFIKHDTLAKLGTNYMDIGLDPWGEVYRVWPGPWRFSNVGAPPNTRWPIPFRIFSVDTGTTQGPSFAVQRDPYVLRDLDENGEGPDLLGVFGGLINDIETWPRKIGFPAQPSKSVFIWSTGNSANSSQMLYRGVYDDDPWNWYDMRLSEPAMIGGGDDINNWDSGNSWQRFYM